MKNRLTVAALIVCATIPACDDGNATGTSQAPRDIGANLSGEAVRPTPVATTATGTTSIRVTTGTSDFYDPADPHLANFTYSITVSVLSGRATSAHIHGPAGSNDVAPVLATLNITSQQTTGLVSNGLFVGTENPLVSGDSLLRLLSLGNAYVDVHTAANPNGEIRGQGFLLNALQASSRR